MHRVLFAAMLAVLAGIASIVFSHQRSIAAQGSCGTTTYASLGVSYRVLFAKNGAVQRYQLVASSHNPEKDHDVLQKLSEKYGPEATNAPPLQIQSFRTGSGGMMIPDKAVDSCGRILSFK